jgi:hypothetical protein
MRFLSHSLSSHALGFLTLCHFSKARQALFLFLFFPGLCVGCRGHAEEEPCTLKVMLLY